MRWFKHMTGAWDEEQLAELVHKYGLEGYGFWWRVVEIVAGKVDKSEQASAEFPTKKWGNLLGLSPKKFGVLADFCAELGLCLLEKSPESLRIEIPNILKLRDEYTEREVRKSGEGRDKVRPLRARVPDTEEEREKEEERGACARASMPRAFAPRVQLSRASQGVAQTGGNDGGTAGLQAASQVGAHKSWQKGVPPDSRSCSEAPTVQKRCIAEASAAPQGGFSPRCSSAASFVPAHDLPPLTPEQQERAREMRQQWQKMRREQRGQNAPAPLGLPAMSPSASAAHRVPALHAAPELVAGS